MRESVSVCVCVCVCVCVFTYSLVTVLDPQGAGVVVGTLIEQLHAVSLSSERRGKMHGYHLQHSISCGEPLPVRTSMSHDNHMAIT